MTNQRAKPANVADPFELLRLDNQLCFALYAAARAITKTYRTKLDELGLTYPQYLVLIVLWETDGLSVSAIGERLKLDSGTLSPILKRLEAAGVLTRRRSAEDEREVTIRLTPEGLALREGALNARRHVACCLGMSEVEILALREDLMALTERLEIDSDADPIE